MSSFVVAFIYRSVEHEENSTHDERDSHYSVIVPKNEERSRSVDMRRERATQGRNVKKFRTVFVKTFDEHSKFSLYVQKYYLLDHMVVYIKRLGMLFTLDSIPYKHFNRHVKQVYRINL